MKKKIIITLCTAVPLTALVAFFYHRSHRSYSVQ